MSFCCGDLLELKYFKDITLIAGEKGLYRQVTWPHICTTETVSEWLNGGELLFVSGAGLQKGEDSLISLYLECAAKELAGMVLLIGGDCIPAVPERLLSLAEQGNFPIFQMPWNLKMIDVTQEISEVIIQRKNKQQKFRNFFNRILFSQQEDEQLEQLAPLYDVPIKPYRFIAVLEITHENGEEPNLDLIKSDIARTVGSSCSSKAASFLSMSYADRVICLVCADSVPYAEQKFEAITQSFRTLDERYRQLTMRLAFGRIITEGKSIRENLREAEKALLFMKMGLCSENICYYSRLGFYKLLFGIERRAEIRDYYWANIGCLVESDRKNLSDFVATLRCYLFHNCNLVKAAQALFIHRNTLVYRLNAIKELLGKDLDDAFVRHELFNSLLAAEFFNRLEKVKPEIPEQSQTARERG